MPQARDLIMERGAENAGGPVRDGVQQPGCPAAAVASREFPDDKLLGLGVIAPGSPEVETPETVVHRVEAAMRFVDKERLTLNPDCGFATTAGNGANFDRAFLKLSAMCRAARLLRDRYP